jgi:hypothetical protein
VVFEPVSFRRLPDVDRRCFASTGIVLDSHLFKESKTFIGGKEMKKMMSLLMSAVFLMSTAGVVLASDKLPVAPDENAVAIEQVASASAVDNATRVEKITKTEKKVKNTAKKKSVKKVGKKKKEVKSAAVR